MPHRGNARSSNFGLDEFSRPPGKWGFSVLFEVNPTRPELQSFELNEGAFGRCCGKPARRCSPAVTCDYNCFLFISDVTSHPKDSVLPTW